MYYHGYQDQKRSKYEYFHYVLVSWLIQKSCHRCNKSQNVGVKPQTFL